MDSQNTIVHELDTNQPATNGMNKSVLIAFGMFVILGIGTGFIVSNVMGVSPSSSSDNSQAINANGVEVKKGDIIGSKDNDFSDNAEGILREGGIEGEGAFHLERPGGESQNVYLTSSVLDLTPFVGRSVKVWGQTQTAQHAGWLMDVGRLQVLD
ncbi:MAG TPA: hypothetical protein PLD54_00835 [Candidatus Levybacteria bacterium]|nr:hypothetical protein [Candidatus Levybacteria bacterium]